jgi:eukaryotic-like serine/threonine-protein kinase
MADIWGPGYGPADPSGSDWNARRDGHGDQNGQLQHGIPHIPPMNSGSQTPPSGPGSAGIMSNLNTLGNLNQGRLNGGGAGGNGDGNGNGNGNGKAGPTAWLPKEHITTLAIGTILQDRYRVETVAGLGGMGAVYKVRDLRFQSAPKYAALKEMITRFTDQVDQRARLSQFDREANILASLSHPAIPSVYDYFTQYERAYLVLEFVEGRDLDKVLNDTQGLLNEQLVGGWAMQLCDVLHYLHTHTPPIVFRDMKPSNVMLTTANTIKLIDFGIAKVFEPESKRGTQVGTEGYSPPEQYRGFSDHRSDIFSLGALMHHLLTRTDPRYEAPFTFHERMPTSLNPTVSPEMEAVIMRCVEGDAENRYRDALELRKALENALHIQSSFTGAFRATGGYSGTISPLAPGLVGQSSMLAGTGLVWKFQTEDEVRSSPVVVNDTVFIGSYDKHLYSLDARSGKQNWKVATDGGICVTPTVWKNLVMVGSEDFNVYGLQADNGQKAWTYATWQPVRSSPRVYGEALYVGSDDGFLHALDPRSGRQLWKFRAWRPIRSSVGYDEGLIYFGTEDEKLHALDAISGDEKWRHATMGAITSTPVVSNGLVYFGSMDFCVYGLDAKMGWQAWSARTQGFVISSPCVVGDRVYVGSVDHHLYCLDAKSGRVMWKFLAGEQITSSPAVSDGAVYFGCIDGAAYCVDIASGRQRWRFITNGPIPSSPAIADGVVYIGSMDGCVYALRV